MIYYIAIIKDSQIQTLKLAGGSNEPEGVREDGTTVIHIDFPIENRFEFVNTRYWEDEWKQRDPSPNQHAIWIDDEWVWDHSDLLDDVRVVRNKMLSQSDWTQMSDADLTEDQKSLWTSYRQELRDLDFVSTNITNVDDVVWPDSP